jgi:predicted permease
MPWQLAQIFINIIIPVFGLVLIGYFAGPRLNLDARSLSRFAYFIVVPAFVFNLISGADVEAALALQMIVYIVAVHIACAVLGFVVAWLLRRPPQIIAAYVLLAVFGNVGNFGLPIVEFRLGQEGLVAATIYFLAITTTAFIIGVAAANWSSNGSLGAILAVFRTPALLAIPPALFFHWVEIEPPLFISRAAALLAGALIPTMLVALGLQLTSIKQPRLTTDVVVATTVRLLGGALLAFLLAAPFGMTGIERAAAIIQSATPTAVLASIIAIEYELLPEFVATTVLFSTLISVVTLTVILAFV